MPNIEFAGFLYDDAGDPVASASVALYDRNTTTPSRASTTTDANGYWAISHATEGRFDVEVTSGSSVRRVKYDRAEQFDSLEVANFRVRNPANTFEYDIVPAAIAADRTLNLPLITATDTLATLGLAQTFSAAQQFDAGITTSAVLATSDDSGALGASGTAFSDLFLASGGVINFNAGDMTITHGANVLTVDGGDFVISSTEAAGFFFLDVSRDSLVIGGSTGSTASIFKIFPGGGNRSFVTQQGVGLSIITDTVNDEKPANTIAVASVASVSPITFTATEAQTYTDAASLYIQGPPVASTNVTITNTALALWVDSGNTRLDGPVFIGDDANANMTLGLTINQGANDDHILAFKSSDVSHGLTSGAPQIAQETDDWLVFRKSSTTAGGASIQATHEDAAGTGVLKLTAVGGTADTAHTTAGRGLIELFVSEHDGANAVADVTTDGNIFTIRTQDDATAKSVFHVTTEGGVYANGASPAMFIGDSANANMTIGLTINQGTSTDQVFAAKHASVAHGLTSGALAKAVETDDFFTIQTFSYTTGGVHIQSLMETSDFRTVLWDSYGGAPTTTDTSSSQGVFNWYGAQHNGANGLADMAANSNLWAIGEIDSGGTRLTRLLLKADDGELHLGNTTLVALDDHDDALLVRAMQKASAESGIVETEYDNPFYSYSKLHELGLAGEKDYEGFFLFPLQSRLHAHEGAIWQNYVRVRSVEDEQALLREEIEDARLRLLAAEQKLAALHA